MRLLDEDLVGFHHFLARKCWEVLAVFLPADNRSAAYRALFRRLRSVLSGRLEARAYCGQAPHCDAFLAPVEPGRLYRKVVPTAEAEHTIRYLLIPGTTPGTLVGELSRACLQVVTGARPASKIKGAGRRIRQEIRQILKDQVYRNESCGDAPLCAVNEAVDPWQRRFVREPAT